MSILKQLDLEILSSDLDLVPFSHFNLPKETQTSFLHELAHLLEFKLNEKDKWNTGKLVFKVKHKGYRNHKRETAVEAIEWHLVRLFRREDTYPYYKYDDPVKQHRSKVYKKKYTKRLIKQRAKHIKQWCNENLDLVSKHKSVGCFILNTDLNEDAKIIINAALKGINNSEWCDFEVEDVEQIKELLASSCFEYNIKGNTVSVLI